MNTEHAEFDGGASPSGDPLPSQSLPRIRGAWIAIGAVLGLALGTGAHFALPHEAGEGPALTPLPSPSPSTSTSVPPPAPAPDPGLAVIGFGDPSELDWRSATPVSSHFGAEVLTDATDVLASVGPLWAIEAESPIEGATATVIQLLAPDGTRYEVANVVSPSGDTLRVLEWDTSTSQVLLENRIHYDEFTYVLLDLARGEWAPFALPAEWLATRIGMASGGRSIYLVEDGAELFRLYAWDFAQGWVPLGETFEMFDTWQPQMIMADGGDWLLYDNKSTGWTVRDLSDESSADIPLSEDTVDCVEAEMVNSTTVVLYWCGDEYRTAVSLETLEMVPVPADYPAEAALRMTESYQVPGTSLVLSSRFSPYVDVAPIRAVGVVTVDGYRELAAFDPATGGMLGGSSGSNGYAPFAIEPAPGLFILSQGGGRVGVIDVVTGQVLAYGEGALGYLGSVLVNAPYPTAN